MFKISERYYDCQTGFTLIELMIVAAIISLLAAIAIPSYVVFTSRANDNACLGEAKAYSNQVFLALNDQEADSVPEAPVLDSCLTMTDASSWTVATQQIITATSRSTATTIIQCDISKGNPCKTLP
ncbi:pilin [Psychrobacter immobilis]|uniref:pilin n=1 Tax=Psychrobacter immobilis TaxID=498 RepID=UPI00191936F7|nr:prepilin-type N-terminal cleavage/methylation domain-containing protein [Psychrobacter immobilis]